MTDQRARRRSPTAALIIAVAVAVTVAIGWTAPGLAQSGSALPASPAEVRAIEGRLSTILDYAGANEISRFRLGSGVQIGVRAYQTVDRTTGRPCRACRVPCRGYRIDYGNPSGSEIAVEGFRCRRADGLWLAVAPETIISQRGEFPPAGSQQGIVTDREGIVTDGQVAALPTPIEEVPIPRPSPRRERETRSSPESAAVAAARAALGRSGASRPNAEQRADAAVGPDRLDVGERRSEAAGEARREPADALAVAANDGDPDDIGGSDGSDRPVAPPVRPLVEGRGDRAVADARPGPDAAASERADRAAGTRPDDAAADNGSAAVNGAGAAAAAPLVARAPEPGDIRTTIPDDGRTPRIITLDRPAQEQEQDTDGPAAAAPPARLAALSAEEADTLASDLDIIETLEELRYLTPTDATPPPEAVLAALAAFAADENLPNDLGVVDLGDRLERARSRNEALVSCAENPEASMCFQEE